MDAIAQFIDNPDGYYSLFRLFIRYDAFNVFAFAALGLIIALSVITPGTVIMMRGEKHAPWNNTRTANYNGRMLISTDMSPKGRKPQKDPHSGGLLQL